MNPYNPDYSIFSACLRNTNATDRFLTFRSNHWTSVYIFPEYYSIQVSENISAKTRVVAKIDFRNATCQTSLAGYFDKIYLNLLAKERKYFVLFITKAMTQPSA